MSTFHTMRYITYHLPYLGRSVTLRLIRSTQRCGGKEELKPVDQNLQYDFNFQQFTVLPEEITVYPVISCSVVISLRLMQYYYFVLLRATFCWWNAATIPQRMMVLFWLVMYYFIKVTSVMIKLVHFLL